MLKASGMSNKGLPKGKICILVLALCTLLLASACLQVEGPQNTAGTMLSGIIAAANQANNAAFQKYSQWQQAYWLKGAKAAIQSEYITNVSAAELKTSRVLTYSPGIAGK